MSKDIVLLDTYSLLKSVAPINKKTKFPYNYWNKNKISDTQNIVEVFLNPVKGGAKKPASKIVVF